MSTFDGIVKEFPQIRIDHFVRNGQPPLACFLSHVHSDHLRGLETLKSPFIYCSAATRQLLLRLEKYPHRMNFAKGVLESRKQTYRHLQKLLRPIPLNTPTTIELCPGYSIRVTLFDANHCTGAVMFLIEGQGKAILYTGDIRSEVWWIDSLARSPYLIPYTSGQKCLDNVYLDTTFAGSESYYRDFPSKADGLGELFAKISQYPDTAVFYFKAWTFGYEDVWLALCNYLDTKVHLDPYRYRMYRSLGEIATKEMSEVAPLVGFQLGNEFTSGCITPAESGIRLHSCEWGTNCPIFKDKDVCHIVPILTRHAGIEYQELGAGGGQGDLDQIHELELSDVSAIGSLMELCGKQLKDQPDLLHKILSWLAKSVKQGGRNVRVDTSAFFQALNGDDQTADVLDDVPIDRLVTALEKLVDRESAVTQPVLTKRITFPYSRHSSLNELRALIARFRPKAVFPNTDLPDLDMNALFGDLLFEPKRPAGSGLVADDGIGTKYHEEDQEKINSPLTTSSERKMRSSSPPYEKPVCSTTPAQVPYDVPSKGSAIVSLPAAGEATRTRNPQTTSMHPPSLPLSTAHQKPSSKRKARPSSGTSGDGDQDEKLESAASRRLRAFEAAIGADGRAWGSDVTLSSVAGGYYNQEKETEL